MSRFPKDYNPKAIGERSEAQVLARFLRYSKVVLSPFGDNQRYDMVVDEGGTFIRVQCKTGKLKPDGTAFTFPTHSSNWNSGSQRDYVGQADVFAVYLPDTDDVYIIPVETAPRRDCTLRLKDNVHASGSNKAEKFLFDPTRKLLEYPRGP